MIWEGGNPAAYSFRITPLTWGSGNARDPSSSFVQVPWAELTLIVNIDFMNSDSLMPFKGK